MRAWLLKEKQKYQSASYFFPFFKKESRIMFYLNGRKKCREE
jgi:hypothetical protein